MKTRIILLGLIFVSSIVDAKTRWLGTLTVDSYPKSGCSITKVGPYIHHGNSGYHFQKQDVHDKDSYLDSLAEEPYRIALANIAKSKGYNAILGFQFDVYGGFDTFDGNVKNGNMGLGLFRVVARGTPVFVECP